VNERLPRPDRPGRPTCRPVTHGPLERGPGRLACVAGAGLLARVARWMDAEDDDTRLALFRQAFAGLWLLYDAIDLAWGTTERSLSWFPHARDPRLVVVQIVLLVSGLMLVAGKRIWLFGVLAAAARTTEAVSFFPLNDFYFGSVVYLLLAHSAGGPFAGGRRAKWVRDALLYEFAWVYLATGLLKLNPDWLSGGHLFVRTQYLVRSQWWPFPAPVERAFQSMAVDSALARLGATLEIALAGVLLARRPYWLGVALALAIHVAGAAMTNVWFFSASMIVGVTLLLPRGRGRQQGTLSRTVGTPLRGSRG
jgi:hypothetical protein